MEELKEYLSYQIYNLEMWDKNMTLSEFGKGKLDAFKDALHELNINSFRKQNKKVCFCKKDTDVYQCKGRIVCVTCGKPINKIKQ